jgi:hypothetical protein
LDATRPASTAAAATEVLSKAARDIVVEGTSSKTSAVSRIGIAQRSAKQHARRSLGSGQFRLAVHQTGDLLRQRALCLSRAGAPFERGFEGGDAFPLSQVKNFRYFTTSRSSVFSQNW